MSSLKIIILVGLLLIGSLIFYLSLQKKSSLKVPEREALQNLFKIYRASWDWKNADVDANSRKDFWTKDIAALYFYKKANGNKSIKLIPKELALADLKPERHFYMDRSFRFSAYKGYGFQMIQKDPIGYYYARLDPSTQIRTTNLKAFGLLAYPIDKSSNLRTFIMNEKCQIFFKIINDVEDVDKWPTEPKKMGWSQVQINNTDD